MEEAQHTQQKSGFFSAVLDTIDALAIVLDGNGLIVSFNKAAETATGFTSAEAINQPFLSLLIQEQDHAFFNSCIGELSFSTTSRCETYLFSKHGKPKIISWHNRLIKQDGNADYIIVTGTDISEQKETAAELLKTNHQLSEAQQIARIGSWEWDILENSITWSNELYHVFDITPEEFAGDFESYIKIVHPEDVDIVLKTVQEAVHNLKPFTIHHRILRRDGIIRHIYSKGNVITDAQNHPLRMAGVAQDVTEYQIAQDTLQFTQFSVDKSSDAVFWVREDARFIYVNESACKMFGYTREELLNMHVYQLETSPNGQKNWPGFWEELKVRRTALVESKVKRKDGSVFPIEINTTYFKFGDKEIKVSYARDITERKRSEQKIKAINHDLSTFIYRSTHDLKAPLASIIGVVNFAKTEVTEPQAVEYLGMIGECAERLHNILDVLIQAMAVKDNNVSPNWINFNKIVYNVLMRLKHLKNFNDIDIDVNINVSTFFSDENLISSILQNVVENAIKYKNEEQPYPYIIINIEEKNNGVHILIADNGTGIEQKQQDKIFDLFYRASGSYKGFGLGLYIVKNAVEKLEGTIDVHSVPGVGTRVSIELPGIKQ
ncbi:MAG: PAS domain-containing sensor histidine kinase [Bacteroidia bacterium]